MRSWIAALLTASAITLAPVSAAAASLQIMPINIEVPAPGAASKVTISNTGGEAANIQVRVFRWIQQNGKDELVETRDVIASPPAVKLGAGKKSVIRVVRVSKTPAADEESYRLVIDEIAPAPEAGAGWSTTSPTATARVGIFNLPGDGALVVTNSVREQSEWPSRGFLHRPLEHKCEASWPCPSKRNDHLIAHERLTTFASSLYEVWQYE